MSIDAAPGSFRDPQGKVLECAGRVFRVLLAPLASFPDTWSAKGAFGRLVAEGLIWPATPISAEDVPAELRALYPDAIGFLEHPRFTPITFPFEWPFELLKRAALLHLRVHRQLLESGLTLSDGSAYNLQFTGSRPVFLDVLSIEPYGDGQPWAGYLQFCETFLNPLILAAEGSDAWQEMYRGRVRGIAVREAARELGWWRAIRRKAFTHVVLNAAAGSSTGAAASPGDRKFSRSGLMLLLSSLENCVQSLQLPGARHGHWGEYENDNSYPPEARAAKRETIEEFIQRKSPSMVLDLGCNTGEYSEIALKSGATRVVGLERDVEAVKRAVERSDRLQQRFLPLQMDVLNLTPSQGWRLRERLSLPERIAADSVMCLALIHHLVLGAGVPLDVLLPGIVELAPSGILEFVPREDPMAARLAGTTQRLHHPYDLATFRKTLARSARIVNQRELTPGGRVLVEYQRIANS